MQSQGPGTADELLAGVRLSLRAIAPTVEESQGALSQLQVLEANGRRLELANVLANPSARRLQVLGCGNSITEACQKAAECAVGLSDSCVVDCEARQPAAGAAVRETTVDVSRAEVEAMAAEMFAASPPPGLVAAPTLEEMLVPGSEASALLATMFTSQQQPHLAYPTEVEALSAAMFGGSSGGHRRLQNQGPTSMGEPSGGVRLSLRAIAPTAEGAEVPDLSPRPFSILTLILPY